LNDIQIKHKGTTQDFKLARDQNGKMMFKRANSRILPSMLTSDRPLSAHVPPQYEDWIRQSTFHAGMGLLNAEVNSSGDVSSKQYYYSVGGDARQPYSVVAEPKDVKDTFLTVTAPTLTNAGFEEGDTTGWTGLDGVDTSKPKTGTYHAKQEIDGGVAESFYQDIATYATYKGMVLTATAYVTASTISTANLTIDDGVNTVSGTVETNTGYGAYKAVTVTAMISPNATRLRIKATCDETSGTFYWDDFSIALQCSGNTPAAFIRFCDYKDFTFAISGDTLYAKQTTGWVASYKGAAAFTDMTTFAGNLYLAMGTSTSYVYFDDGVIYTTDTGEKPKYMAATATQLWISVNDYQIKSSEDPTNGGVFSSAVTIGDSDTVISRLINHAEHVMIPCQNALWEYNADGSTTDWIDALHSEKDSWTGYACCFWHSKVYIATGFGHLYELDLDDGTINTLNPLEYAPGLSDYAGNITAMVGDSSFLYMAINDGTEIQILCGRWEVIDGTKGWRFHTLKTITLTDSSNNARSLHISPFPDDVRKLYIGCSSTTDKVYYLYHPNNYGDLIADTDYLFDTGGYLVTSWYYGQYSDVIKTFYNMDVFADNTSATETIGVHYRLYGESSWTSLGTITSTSGSLLLFNLHVSSIAIQFKFTFNTGDETTSPQLLGFTLRCVARPFSESTERLTVNEFLDFITYGGDSTSWIHEEFLVHKKLWRKLAVMAESLSEARYITVYYRVDDDADWTTLTPIVSDSPYQGLEFPENLSGHILYLKFEKSDPDINFIAYTLEGEVVPKHRKEFTFSVVISPQTTTGRGAPMKENVDDRITFIEGIDGSDEPAELTTWFDGNTYSVTFLDMQQEVDAFEDDNDKTLIYTIHAKEVV